MHPIAIERWHEVVRSRDTKALSDLLDESVVFESPVVHTPQSGKAITQNYLQSAMEVLNNDSFKYLNQWFGPTSAVLEFQSSCEGILINGIDMITWNEANRITHFKVMVRPLKAVNKLHELMGRQLMALQQRK
jgi:hypothetical protein